MPVTPGSLTRADQDQRGDAAPGDLTPIPASGVLRVAWGWAVWSFINQTERRLRAGWRLLAHLVLFVLVAALASKGLWLAGGLIARLAPDAQVDAVAPLLFAVLGGLQITLTVWVARRLFDRRSFVSLGLALDRRALSELALGFLLAGAMQASVFGTTWAEGWLDIKGFVWQTHALGEIAATFVSLIVVFALVGWYEELLARGYWLQNLSEGLSWLRRLCDGLNRPLAVLISSLVFAVGHARNPNVTWVAVVGLVGAGLLLAWAYVRTGRLWLAMGIHFGWNFFEGPVFGFPVSGVKTMSLLEITVSGPVLWTGGEFGPEAGLVLLPALALSALAIGLVTRGRGLRASVAVD
jgi:uncharacterized protein